MINAPTPHGWSNNGQDIDRTFTFASFIDGITFINSVAKLAELQNHHPDITINYCNVTLRLTTHDAGGLTEKDFELATAINEIPL